MKVSLGYRDGYIGEGQISYAGSGAVRRARLAAAVARDRLERSGIAPGDLRCDLIGVSALHGERCRPRWRSRMKCASASPPAHRPARPPSESVKKSRRLHQRSGRRWRRDPIGPRGVAIASTFIPRALVPCTVQLEVA